MLGAAQVSSQTTMESPHPLRLCGELPARSEIPARLEDFVARLPAEEVGPCSCNHYAAECEGSDLRRANLLLYLSQMADRQPKVMLVGEAPGYRGCRLTGVPFTSEYIVEQGITGGLFGRANGYRTSGPGVSREQTASIMWEALGELSMLPLLWNAYPFHPFQTGNERSNRPPSMAEINRGAEYLLALMEIFEIETVIAVGNKAHLAVSRAGLASEKVRHPSHGGKAAFIEGLRQVLAQARKGNYPSRASR
jgi:uracil-DNA glycosylase